MLVKIEEGTYLNIKNVAYISIEEKDFSYTTMGSKSLSYVDLGVISRDELISLFESENAKKQFLGLSGDRVKIYLNVETITKVDFEAGDEGVKVHVWFINDDNPYTFHIKYDEHDDDNFIDRFIKEINERLGRMEPQYVDHF